jgi:hypothetical protein
MACSGASQQNTTYHTGDSVRRVVNFVDCAGSPVDVSGTTLTYTIHQRYRTDALLTKISPSQIIVANDGESAAILLLPADTAYRGTYFHKLVITDGAGNILTTFTGQIEFSDKEITSCEALTAHIDTDLFVPGFSQYSFDFSSASNSMYVAAL